MAKDNIYDSNKLLKPGDLKHLGVDFDNTIAKKIFPEVGIGEPLPQAITSLKFLQTLGWKIWIFSARPWADYIAVEKWCHDHGFYPDGIILGKPLFKMMIDDVGFRFTDWRNDLPEIEDILRRGRT